MATKNPDADYDADKVIRRTYVASSPKQRLHVIAQRLGHKDSGPNNLVTAVSAVEALARSIVVHHPLRPDKDVQEMYQLYRTKGAEELLLWIMYLQGSQHPDEFYGEDNWQLLKYAVTYRNLVAHECTYVGDDKSVSMIAACKEILVKLAAIAGVPDFDPDI